MTVTANGKGVVSHAGAVALRLTVDRTGLTGALSRALYREDFTPGHDQGRVLAYAAVVLADGANTIRGIDVLRHQSDLLGEVASAATLCRALGEVDDQTLASIDAARAEVRTRHRGGTTCSSPPTCRRHPQAAELDRQPQPGTRR